MKKNQKPLPKWEKLTLWQLLSILISIFSSNNLQARINQAGIYLTELENIPTRSIRRPEYILRGIFRCHCGRMNGQRSRNLPIDEKPANSRWEHKRGLSNTMSLTGIKRGIAHVTSLPALQAKQFKKKHTLSFDENGTLKPAYQIDRPR